MVEVIQQQQQQHLKEIQQNAYSFFRSKKNIRVIIIMQDYFPIKCSQYQGFLCWFYYFLFYRAKYGQSIGMTDHFHPCFCCRPNNTLSKFGRVCRRVKDEDDFCSVSNQHPRSSSDAETLLCHLFYSAF